MDVAAHEGIWYETLEGVSVAVRNREVSATELTSSMLDRINSKAAKLNCFINVLSEQALATAKALDELSSGRVVLGPLHGVPISIKDNIAVAGAPMTIGSAILVHSMAEEDATIVKRLRAAGAVILAKDNLYDFAYCAPNPRFGPTHNPWELDHSCAGSSSGSAAAVAAGMVYASIGTDGGGSIRMPASFCGVTGIKTSYGLISRVGEVLLHPTLSTPGPITRAVRDAAILLTVLAGPDPRDPVTAHQPPPDFLEHLEDGVSGLRIAIVEPSLRDVVSEEVRKAVIRAYRVLEDQGAHLEPVSLPDLALARNLMWIISGAEAVELLRPHLASQPDLIHPTTRGLLERALFISAADYLHAQRVRRQLVHQVRDLMSGFEVLLTPTVPIPAYRIGQPSVTLAGHSEEPLNMSTRYTALFNLTGQPAMTVPCGLSADGLPIGLQIAAAPMREDLILRVARSFERATSWHELHPSL